MIGNYSALDMLKMGKTLSEDQIYDMADSYENKIAELQSDIERMNKQMELIEEQKYFATEIIDQVEQVLKTETRAKEIKKHIELAIETSYLDR